MIVKLKTTQTITKEVDIKFPFYEERINFGEDSEYPYSECIKLTKIAYTRIIVKPIAEDTCEISVLTFKRNFKQLEKEDEEHIEFQKECKKAYEKALKQAKETLLKL